jgi:hypothetical protein
MAKKRRPPSETTPTGIRIGKRTRNSVLKDFEKASGPLRGQNQDQKPKA